MPTFKTPCLRFWSKRPIADCRLVNGLGSFFLEQAVLNFRLWTGMEPERR